MPTEHTFFTYSFDELTEEAQATAIDAYREARDDAWDSSDNESLAETMLYTFAEKLRAPGWDTYGSGDFPGIPGLTVEGWDLDRGESYVVRGTLYRDDAPGLPWPEDATHFSVGNRGYDDTLYGVDADGYDIELDDAAFSDAWRDALYAALAAGRNELAYLSSDEYLRERLEEGWGETFLEDGKFYSF